MLARLFDPMPGTKPLSVRDVCSLYVRHLDRRREVGDFSAQSYADIVRELTNFCGRYGDRPLTECRRHDLTEWLDLHPQWRSGWTRKRVAETIIRPFAWAADEEIIAACPYRMLRHIRGGRPRRPATEREYIVLMRGASRALRRALFFMRRTGARTKEVRELLWIQIDFVRGFIQIDEHKTIRQQREPRPRIIGIDPATLRFLANLYRQKATGQSRVFVNCDGKPWSRHTFARHMNRWGTRLGLEPSARGLSPYCFRHTYGTNAIEAGVGEKQLADQMGHTTTRLIAYYAHTAGKVEHLKRVAVDALKRRR